MGCCDDAALRPMCTDLQAAPSSSSKTQKVLKDLHSWSQRHQLRKGPEGTSPVLCVRQARPASSKTSDQKPAPDLAWRDLDVPLV